MKKENLIIGAVAIFGLLTLVNSYKLFFSNDGQTLPPANSAQVSAPINNQGPTNPSAVPTQDFTQPVAPVQPDLPKTAIKFDETEHSFGEILQNSENKYSFTFRNSGVEPLVISNAKGSCGCTVPNYPKEPVLPGATATIDVVYSPGMQSGSQNKTVTLTANTDPIQTILNISADVKADPNAPKPEAGGNQLTQPVSINPLTGQ
jgi:hypothetical protein